MYIYIRVGGSRDVNTDACMCARGVSMDDARVWQGFSMDVSMDDACVWQGCQHGCACI